MIKLFKLNILVLAALIFGSPAFVHAQDTTKKAKPVAVKAPATNADAKLANPTYKRPATPLTQTPAQNTPATATLTPAQQPVQAPADKSLRGQYQYLLTKVYNYQQPLVMALFKNYTDTLTATRRQLKEAQAAVASQTKMIDTLKTTSTSKDQFLAESKAKVDEISLLGIPLTKVTYNWIMWGLVIAFGAIAAIVIARSGSHSREAKYRIKLYDELEEEYRTYKAKANEKEKKLARELQTERNKLDELQNGGN